MLRSWNNIKHVAVLLHWMLLHCRYCDCNRVVHCNASWQIVCMVHSSGLFIFGIILAILHLFLSIFRVLILYAIVPICCPLCGANLLPPHHATLPNYPHDPFHFMLSYFFFLLNMYVHIFAYHIRIFVPEYATLLAVQTLNKNPEKLKIHEQHSFV